MKSNLLFLFSVISFVLLSAHSYAQESCSAGFYHEINSAKFRELQNEYHNCKMTNWRSDDNFDVCCSKPPEASVAPQPQPSPPKVEPPPQAGSGSASRAKRPSQSRKAPREEQDDGDQNSGSRGDSSVLRQEIKSGYQPGSITGSTQQAGQEKVDEQCNGTAYPKFYMKFSKMEDAEGFQEANGSKCGVNGFGDGYAGCCQAGWEPRKGLTADERRSCVEASEDIKQCQKERETAESRCDPENGDLGVWIKGMKAGNMFGTQAMGMTMGIQGVCEKAAGLMTGLNTALAAFQGMCESSRGSCMTSCQNVIKKMRNCPAEIYPQLATSKPDMEKNLGDCRDASRINESVQSVNMAMSSFQQAQQCAALTKTMNMTVCTQNPFAPGCAGANQTCNNPSFAATNPVCMGLVNPGGSATTTQAGAPKPGGSGGLPDLKSTGGFTGENIGGGLDPMDGALAAGGPGGPGAPVGEDPGGKKGSGAPLNPNGGGGQGGGAGGGGGGGYDQEKLQVYGGTYGSGSGGAFGAGRGGASGSAAGTRYPGNASGTAFSKFNPAMAGMSRNSGLTGANGASIWQKVSNRYKAKEHSMKGVAH